MYSSTTVHVSQRCDHCLVLISAAVAMKTVTMEVTQPSTAGPVCPGQEVTLTCTVTQTGGDTENIILIWTRYTSNSITHIQIHSGREPATFGDFIIYANLMNATNSTTIVSNMTLKSAAFANNNNNIYCRSPPHDISQTETIIVEGTQSNYFGMA